MESIEVDRITLQVDQWFTDYTVVKSWFGGIGDRYVRKILYITFFKHIQWWTEGWGNSLLSLPKIHTRSRYTLMKQSVKYSNSTVTTFKI